jgi:osmotically-inducible protein OsmY
MKGVVSKMLSGIFGPKYDDEKLCEHAERGLIHEPLIQATHFDVSSTDGVILLHGRASSELEKSHALSAVRNALDGSGLKYERIEDDISLA